jgi:hypothetical protein
MALIVENGTGVAGADAYAAQSVITQYWADRPHSPFAAIWAAAASDVRDGGTREATSYLDATSGPYYRGKRSGYIQGLLWPRNFALDDEGFPLPSMPPELVQATCELSARAVSAALSVDQAIDGRITEQTTKIDVITETIKYADGVQNEAKYGSVDGILAPILNGSQPSAKPAWNWK